MLLLDNKEVMYFERFPETLRVKKNTGIHFQDLLYMEDSSLVESNNVLLMSESNRYLLSADEENASLTDLFYKLFS